MDDTPVIQSSQPTAPSPQQSVPVGGGYVDPLTQIPPTPAPQQLQGSPAQSQPVHSFEPEDIPVTQSHGSMHKEFAPRQTPVELRSGHESAPEIPPQVVEAGVEHSPEISQEKNLQAEIAQATHELTAAPQMLNPQVVQSSSNAVLPLSRMEADEIIKTTSVDSGRRWWATLVDKLLKRSATPVPVDPL